MTVSVPVPADSTGRYPELVGYQPITTERRAAVFCGDAALTFAAFGIAGVVSVALGRSPAASVAPGVVVALYYLVELWALLFRSSRLSGVFMKASYVGVVTGRGAPGRLLLSFLLRALVGAITLGIGPLIIFFVSIKPPFQRNWFDRVTGLMLVDYRTGRRPGTPAPAPAPHVGPPPVAPVYFPGGPEAAPDQTWTPAAPPVPTTRADGIITSTPFARPAPAVPVAPAAPAAPAAAVAAVAADPVSGPSVPVIREMRSVAAAAPEFTELADLASGGVPAPPLLDLSDGRRIRLGTPAVFGRNPQAPGSHPDAVAYPVEDPLASKTHALFGADERGAWVIDLHSTNGVWVTAGPARVPTKATPGTKTVLPTGSSVRFGDQIAKVS